MLRALLLLLALASAAPAAPDSARTEAASLRFAVPTAWTRVPAPSDVRAAQYTIPHADGDGEDGELILFFFGEGKGGSADDNLARWYGQFTQPDGRESREAAVVTIRTVNGLRVTAVDLGGTYVGMQTPGTKGPEPKTKFRMLAAVIDGQGGPWFFRALGPAATVSRAKPDFDKLLDSVEVHR